MDIKEKPKFVMHWLNNKEMVFTQTAEKLINEWSVKVMQAQMAAQQQATPSEPGSDVDEPKIEEDPDSVATGESKKLDRKKLDQDAQSRHTVHTVSSSASLAAQSEAGSVATSMPPAESKVGPPHPSPISDLLDRKFEALLRDWNASPDLLFSIHPIDGSLLVWLVEYLDETSPGSFRQPRVSFSSRIPNAIPLGDAATMSHNLALYSPATYLDLKILSSPSIVSNLNEVASDQQINGNSKKEPAPTVCMISKHNNGSLNQWSLTFADLSFTQIMSVTHSSRVSGHRFRVNDIACHPVLPLLLTTSHHNLPGPGTVFPKSDTSSLSNSPSATPSPSVADQPPLPGVANTGFCSELILWKVDPVGPQSKTGGVTELARVNSPELSAFANVAWLPTLLPNEMLGPVANSPSACFIASDGHQLRVYQAVLDATSLLAEMASAHRKNLITEDNLSLHSENDNSSDGGMFIHNNLHETFRIVSLQSTSRPGCIIELTAISDAIHDWHATQLLHVFQEQLIKGDKATANSWAEELDSPGLVKPGLGAVVDLRHTAVFEEPFYLVILEKNPSGRSVVHMWKLIISSDSGAGEGREDKAKLLKDGSKHSSSTGTPDSAHHEQEKVVSPLKITTSKVCTQELPLPEEVEVIHATPTAGHLPSSNIYPACLAPYVLCTAGSDGLVRFWRCDIAEQDDAITFNWVEWEMTLNKGQSAIELPGQPLYVSCAYSGRIAAAYKCGQSFTKPTSANPNTRLAI